MKKQITALALAAMMAAASLAGCSSKPAETSAPETEAQTEAEQTKAEEAEAAEAENEETEAEAEAEQSENKGVLVMATNAEFPPYEFHDGGEIVGIDVEIAAAIAAEMGMDFEVEDIAFDSIIPEVQSGKADFGAAGMTVTEDRKQSVDFSDSYATATQVIIIKEDNADIVSPDDLEGKTIGVQLGTTGDIYASDIADATIEQYNKGFEAVQALTQNKIDAVIIDGEPAKVFVAENEGLKILDEAFTTEEYAICVKKGNTELLEGINAAIASLKESGELQKIVDKYITAE
ncbi:MAG: basic amino acid ABC transporter substrate-binding protein [Clostridium sp.]|jgi:ABC-type amino acid transport substrate-binding protein|nr:basic amino acid ABC transporter substrate-binding protein [Clostridium sp.]